MNRPKAISKMHFVKLICILDNSHESVRECYVKCSGEEYHQLYPVVKLASIFSRLEGHFHLQVVYVGYIKVKSNHPYMSDFFSFICINSTVFSSICKICFHSMWIIFEIEHSNTKAICFELTNMQSSEALCGHRKKS